jgi:hypothetical protein
VSNRLPASRLTDDFRVSATPKGLMMGVTAGKRTVCRCFTEISSVASAWNYRPSDINLIERNTRTQSCRGDDSCNQWDTRWR